MAAPQGWEQIARMRALGDNLALGPDARRACPGIFRQYGGNLVSFTYRPGTTG